MTKAPLEPELLLAQSGWVRALARRLVGDPELSDDLAQDALLVALERPPRELHGEPGLRAWLAGVLRNLVRLRRRGEARRRRREERAARPELVAPTVDTVERAARFRLVVESVMALDEPYRSTVLMRTFDGLSYEQIARRSEVSPAAARKRFSRGLEALRVQLDGQFGGERRAWIEALAPVLAPLDVGGRVVGLGGITMAQAAKTVGALSIAILAGVGLWPRAGAHPGATPLAPDVASALVDLEPVERSMVNTVPARVVHADDEDAVEPRESPPVRAPVASAGEATDAVDDHTPTGVHGRVWCRDEKALRDARGELVIPADHLLAWPEGAELDLEDRRLRVGPEGGVADVAVLVFGKGKGKDSGKGAGSSELATTRVRVADLRFEPHVTVVREGWPLSLDNHEPYLVSVRAGGRRMQVLTALLDPSAGVSIDTSRAGVVELSSDDRPWMGARVVVTEARWFAVSASDGSFELPDVPPGKYRFELWHGDAREKGSVVVPETGAAELRYELLRGKLRALRE